MINTNVIPLSSSSAKSTDVFAIIDQIAQYLDKAEIKPYKPAKPESILRFESSSKDTQQAIFNKASGMLEFIKYAEILRPDFKRNQKSFFELGLSLLNYSIPDEVKKYIKEEDVTEVYGSDFIQVFGNLEFMKRCSYSIDQVFVYEWWELFERPEEVTEHFANIANKVIRGKLTLAIAPGEEHIVKEVFSEKKKVFTVRQKAIGPTYNEQKQIIGIVSVMNAKEIGASSND